MKPSVQLLVLALLGSVLAGCQAPTAWRLANPTAQVTTIHLAEQTEYGARLEIELLLENPNQVPLPVTQVHYEVDVPGVGRYTFSDQPHRTMPAGGRQRLMLPAAIAVQGVSLAGQTVQVAGRVIYDPPGEIRRVMTEARIPLPDIAFTGSAQLR